MWLMFSSCSRKGREGVGEGKETLRTFRKIDKIKLIIKKIFFSVFYISNVGVFCFVF